MEIQKYGSQKGVPENLEKNTEKPFIINSFSKFGYIIFDNGKQSPIDIMPEYLIKYFERNVGTFDYFQKEFLEKFCPWNKHYDNIGTVNFDSKNPPKYLKEYSKLWSLLFNGEEIHVSKKGILTPSRHNIESRLFEMVIDNCFINTRQSEFIKRINESKQTFDN